MERRPMRTAPLLPPLLLAASLLGPSLPPCRAFCPPQHYPNNLAFVVVDVVVDRDAPIRRIYRHQQHHRRRLLPVPSRDAEEATLRGPPRGDAPPVEPGDAPAAAAGVPKEQRGQSFSPWIPAGDAGIAASAAGYESTTRFRDAMVDVAAYSDAIGAPRGDVVDGGKETLGVRGVSSAEIETRQPCSYLRLRPEAASAQYYAAAAPSASLAGGVSRASPPSSPTTRSSNGPRVESNTTSQHDEIPHELLRRADDASEATMRWCDDFVSHLGLCPWAKQSIMTEGAIRIKVVPQHLGIGAFEDVIRDASEELLRITGKVGYECSNGEGEGEPPGTGEEYVDPNVAITFVVAPPPAAAADASLPDDITAASSTDNYSHDFEFVPFHEFTCHLEDRFFEESLEYEHAIAQAQSSTGSDDDDDETPRIGDWITIAPFHPHWRFASGDDEGDDDSVDWEKRTPFPTVSLVRTDAIMAAGEEATKRIGVHNEEVLNGLGSRVLREMFRERVLQR